MGRSILTILQEYEYDKNLTCKQNEFRDLQSALLRFVAPGWGAPAIKGNRMTLKESAAIKEFIGKVESDNLYHLIDTFNKVCDEQKIHKELRRKKRYILNKFLDWAIKRGFVKDESKALKTPKWRADKKQGELNFSDIQALENDGVRGVYSPYSLGSCPGDYINPILEKQIQACIKFGENNLGRTSGIGKKIFNRLILCILGWLHREKGVPLDEISLTSLVPVISLHPSIKNFNKIEDYWRATAIAVDTAKEEAKKVVSRAEEFFEWRALVSHEFALETKVNYMDLIIFVAKYLYRDQTDINEALNFEDIIFVRHLQVARTRINRKAKEQQIFKKAEKEANLLEWWEAWQVLHELKLRADCTKKTYSCIRRSGNKKGRKDTGGYRRPVKAIAKDIQKFILFAFFVIIPPDRQRTFRELSIGGTLKHGLFDKKGKFTPVSSLEYRNLAKYYIDLGKNQYKTSKKYGPWRGEIPNYIFPDGTSFYSYLDKWLYFGYQDENGDWHGFREALKPENHKFFFVQHNGKPFQNSAINERFHSICGLFLQKRVNPHDLRHSFNTHLAEIGASQEERESASYWMKHSLEIARAKYEHVKMETKLEPAKELTQKGVFIPIKEG